MFCAKIDSCQGPSIAVLTQPTTCASVSSANGVKLSERVPMARLADPYAVASHPSFAANSRQNAVVTTFSCPSYVG